MVGKNEEPASGDVPAAGSRNLWRSRSSAYGTAQCAGDGPLQMKTCVCELRFIAREAYRMRASCVKPEAEVFSEFLELFAPLDAITYDASI